MCSHLTEPLITEKINYPNLKKRKAPGDLPEPAAVRDNIAQCEDPVVGKNAKLLKKEGKK